MSIFLEEARRIAGETATGAAPAPRFEAPPRRPRDIVSQVPPELAALRAELAAERLVSGELAHRNRNLLAVVAALIRRALDGAADLTEARAALEDLGAKLAAAHSAHAPRGPRDLAMLAETALAAFDAGGERRIAVSGPKVALTAEADRILALALFELATNAVKHGALRGPDGRIALDWAKDKDGGLRLTWREYGDAPPAGGARTGGGHALMRRIGELLDGAVTIDAGTGSGFSAEITLGARHLLPPAGAGPRRVLVVEDNPLIAVDLADMLVAQGVEDVAVAMSLAEARTALAAGSFDLALLDVSIGDACSDALLPDLGGTAVVVVSGRDAADLPPALAGRPLLAKPFQPSDVAAMLAHLAETKPPG